jgi:hypothetical protein
MFGYSISSDHQLYRVTPLKRPFGLILLLFQSQSHVTTITHSYSLRCVTFTQLTITILHWLTSQLSFTVSNYHRLYIFTLRNSRRDLTPRIHFLRLLLNNWLVGLLLKTEFLEISVPLINPQTYEPGESCVASGHCVYRRCLGNERAAVTSSRPAIPLPQLETARSKHRFPYCRAACTRPRGD